MNERLSEERLPSVNAVLLWLRTHGYVTRVWDDGGYDEDGGFVYEGWGEKYFACSNRTKTVGPQRIGALKVLGSGTE